MVGASLMVRTVLAIGRVELGFRPDRVLALRVPLPDRKYPDPARRVLFFQEALRSIASVPGVTAAGVNTTAHPFGNTGVPVEVPGMPAVRAAARHAPGQRGLHEGARDFAREGPAVHRRGRRGPPAGRAGQPGVRAHAARGRRGGRPDRADPAPEAAADWRVRRRRRDRRGGGRHVEPRHHGRAPAGDLPSVLAARRREPGRGADRGRSGGRDACGRGAHPRDRRGSAGDRRPDRSTRSWTSSSTRAPVSTSSCSRCSPRWA